MERSICQDCKGTGVIVRHRSRWIGGGKLGYRDEWTVRETCECGGGDVFEVEGQVVNAPGFTPETFGAFVDRAKSAQLRTTPARGCVKVQSGSSPAQYAVTRSSCSCQGHGSHGRCYHRALCIYLYDVQGVDLMQVPTIGFSKRGVSLTIGRKSAAKAVA